MFHDTELLDQHIAKNSCSGRAPHPLNLVKPEAGAEEQQSGAEEQESGAEEQESGADQAFLVQYISNQLVGFNKWQTSHLGNEMELQPL